MSSASGEGVGLGVRGIGVNYMQGTFDFKRQDCHIFADDIFKSISLNECVWITLETYWNLFLESK